MPSSSVSFVPSGEILSVDDGFEECFGYNISNVIGRNIQDIIIPLPDREA